MESAVERFVRDYTAYVDSHRGAGVELLDALPRVVLVPGLGMFTAGQRRAHGRDRQATSITTRSP